MKDKLKALSTEEFSKLPTVKLHFLKIEILGQRLPLIFKSLDSNKITEKLKALETLYGTEKLLDNTIEVTLDTFTCKNTLEYYDINGQGDSINSFKGELI